MQNLIAETEIRSALLAHLEQWDDGSSPSVIVEELALCQGDARIDVAVVNGKIEGYEIKADADRLDRLPTQRDVYNKVIDTMFLVSTNKHLSRAKHLIPRWWGIIVVTREREGITLRIVRDAKPNPSILPYAYAQLLWRDEALKLLECCGIDKGLRNRPKHELWQRLASQMPRTVLFHSVRAALTARKSWRSARRQM